jgi:hypothetical protein
MAKNQKTIDITTITSGTQVNWPTFVYDSFHKARSFNMNRFINYCHPGTVLVHGTSKVKWTVKELVKVKEGYDEWPYTESTTDKIFVSIESEKGYKKQVDTEQFYMYDIVHIPKAVEVLWGSLADNPTKKPEDFIAEQAGIFFMELQVRKPASMTYIPITLHLPVIKNE